MAFEQSDDLSYHTINALLQRNVYTYPCADHILRDPLMLLSEWNSDIRVTYKYQWKRDGKRTW
jgi:hypothetical protein